MTRQHLSVDDARPPADLDRRKLVTSLLAERSDTLIVSSLGAPCWDVAAAGDHDLNFYVWGAMGSAAMLALGLAVAQPERRVIAVVGDGDILMGLGSLPTIAVAQPRNLALLVLDNERYGDTGNQPSLTAASVDLEATARAAGFSETAVLRAEDDIGRGKRLLFDSAGPVFVVGKVASEKSTIVLPPRDGTFLKHRFQRALLG
jgi:thiamine pyrophosphate-dependent acetolactate synthase large subunit-like protein